MSHRFAGPAHIEEAGHKAYSTDMCAGINNVKANTGLMDAGRLFPTAAHICDVGTMPKE